MLANWLGIRARLLRQGLSSLLNDRTPASLDEDTKKWLKDIFFVEPAEFKYTSAGRFYHEPTIRVLAKKGDNEWYSIRNTKPSYLSKELYAKTILNMFNRRGRGVNEKDRVFFAVETNAVHLQPETHRKFLEMLHASNGDYTLFTTSLEDEFSEMMDRVTGWYKRKIGFILFWLGFLICAALNVDTFQIVSILSSNPKARQDMMKLAQEMVKDDQAEAGVVNISPDSPTYLDILEQGYGKAFRDAKDADFLLGKGWDIDGEPYLICVDFTEASLVDTVLNRSAFFQPKIAHLRNVIDSLGFYEPGLKDKIKEYYMLQAEYRTKVLDPLGNVVDEKIHSIESFNLDEKCRFKATVEPGIITKTVYICGQVLPFWKSKFWGIVLSALALSLGANFWFDLLKRLVAIRSAGVKPEEKPETLNRSALSQPKRDGTFPNVNDPIEKVLSESRKYWESLRGVTGINRAVLESSVEKKEIIEIVFDEGVFVKGTIPSNISNIPIHFVTGKPVRLQPQVVLEDNSSSAPLHSIIHATTGSWGTATGLFKDELTNKTMLLSCGHVLRSDTSGYIKEYMDKVNIQQPNGPLPLGRVINLNLSNYIDAAVVELSSSNTDYPFVKVHSSRPVNNGDEINRTQVLIKTLGGDKQGIIYLINRSYKVLDKIQDYFMYKLILIRNDPAAGVEKNKQLTISGDSGSLVTDARTGEAIGIHIGAFESEGIVYYAAIGLHDILQLFHLKTIKI